ncbi:hypothetical protein Tco_0133717 [Tanacetum coccineum]
MHLKNRGYGLREHLEHKVVDGSFLKGYDLNYRIRENYESERHGPRFGIDFDYRPGISGNGEVLADQKMVQSGVKIVEYEGDKDEEMESKGSTEVEDDNICLAGFDGIVHISEEIELFDHCSLDMLKLFEVDQKIHWKSKAPCVVFIDELDTVGKQKGTGLGYEALPRPGRYTALLRPRRYEALQEGSIESKLNPEVHLKLMEMLTNIVGCCFWGCLDLPIEVSRVFGLIVESQTLRGNI